MRLTFCAPLSPPLKRPDGGDHRSPSVHHPERGRGRRAGLTARGRVRPTRRPARRQTRTVPETHGETGLSARGAEGGPTLRH